MGPNSITSGMQSSTVSLPPATPGELQNLNELQATGFRYGKDGLEWNAWLDMASRSTNPQVKAQYRELVDLAGGRTDRPSLLKAMELAQAYFTANREGATANDQRALGHAMERSLFHHFSQFNPTELLTSPLRSAALVLLETSGANQTEWGQSLGQAIRMDASFRQGLAEGIWQGGKDMVTGIAWLAGKTVQLAADNSLAGIAGDQLRGLTGKMPGWLEAVIPSNARGQENMDAIGSAIGNAASYIANNSPSEIASDIGDAIGNAWDGLKADHARAAAQGPEAEARWWGQTIGRIGFEVAATFAGGVGVAGKASKGAKAAEGLADVADAANDAARAADAANDIARPAIINGRNQIYVDGAGTKGNWRAEINGRKLDANADYHVNGYKFSTDAKGRVTSVEGELTLQKAERNGYQQGVSGREDRLPDDQGGHLIASIFNGPGEAINLKAMNGNFNMGAYRTLEDTLADALKAGKNVEVKIDVIHSGDSLRPEGFVVEYVINGVKKAREFDNVAGG